MMANVAPGRAAATRGRRPEMLLRPARTVVIPGRRVMTGIRVIRVRGTVRRNRDPADVTPGAPGAGRVVPTPPRPCPPPVAGRGAGRPNRGAGGAGR